MIVKKLILTVCGFIAFLTAVTAQSIKAPVGSKDLYNTLAIKDSLLFDIIFKTCDLKKLETILAKDFVFYHDGGYNNSTTTQDYADFMKNIKERCENKDKGPSMHREIVEATLQVFPVHSDEAIQTGVQRFYLTQKGEKERLVEESKFSRKWNKVSGNWQLSRELDYMVNTKPVQPNSEERYQPKPYVPDSFDLYNKIVSLDSIFFNTYNTCDMEKMSSMFAEDLEFYHDKTGLSTSKKEVLESTHKNICGKVTRTLVKGSIEVYPIHNFGAVEIGYHYFHNKVEEVTGEPSKFIILWRLKDDQWQITRVVSLH
jgi:hypothetical protein